MDMQTRTGSADAWPAEPHAIPSDILHREDIFREEPQMHALSAPTTPMPRVMGLFKRSFAAR